MEDYLPETIPQFLKRTANLLIHLHDGCNLRCRHCYLDASPTATHQLPLGLLIRTIDEAHTLGIKSVQFSGGEPFAYPEITKVLSHCRDKAFKPSISTNGTCMGGEHIRLLGEIGADVNASVDGSPDYHDRFRGQPGCFRQTETAIGGMVTQGINVKVVSTICEDNFDAIPWLAAWALEQGVSELQFQPLERVGRGEQLARAGLNHERICDLFLKLSDLRVTYEKHPLKITMTYKSRDRMIEHPCMAFVCNGKSCHRGVSREIKNIVVRENGEILPELMDINPSYAIGNLYAGTLHDNLKVFLTEGYYRFDRLCRHVFENTVRNYPSPLIPWNEILARESYTVTEEQIHRKQA